MIDKQIDLTSIFITAFIFGSVVLDPGDNLMKIIKVVFVIPCLVYTMRSKKIYFDAYIKWMVCFTTIAGLSFLWAISFSNAAFRYQTLVLNFICIYCLLVYVLNRSERINLILKAMIFAPIILEIRVIYSHGFFAFADTRNVDGIMSPNAIGMRAGIAVALGAYYFLSEKRHKVIYLLISALNIAIVVLSASRKALVFMLIPLVLYLIFSQKNKLKLIRNVLASILLICLAYYEIMNITFLYDIVGYRVETMVYGILGLGITDGSTSLRLKMIEWGIEWFKVKPWLGYGINNYMNLLGTMKTSYGTTGVYAHNNYIELLVDLGLIGTFVYYFIYLKMLIKAVHIGNGINPNQLIMACILTSVIVNEFGMVTYCDIFVQIVLVLTWSVLFSIGRKKNERGNIYALE